MLAVIGVFFGGKDGGRGDVGAVWGLALLGIGVIAFIIGLVKSDK